MIVLSGMALAGIFIFSGILFPVLNGRQSATGKYVSVYHWIPKLNRVTAVIEINVALRENRGFTSSRFQNKNAIRIVSRMSLINDVFAEIGIQSPKHPQFLNFPDK